MFIKVLISRKITKVELNCSAVMKKIVLLLHKNKKKLDVMVKLKIIKISKEIRWRA